MKVFIDGSEGTTGLEIHKHLDKRSDIELIKIPNDKRKDLKERALRLNEADIVFLCLPDAAAKEAVSLIENSSTRVIDASTAHRTCDGWVYGIPELEGQRAKIKNASRVAVPGCFATGFVMLLRPLIESGIVQNDYPICCHAVSGYSGGGKERINKINEDASFLKEPCFYALSLEHKHIPEMQKHARLAHPPLFSPIIANYYRGMIVAVPFISRLLKTQAGVNEFRAALFKAYGSFDNVKVHPVNAHEDYYLGFLSPASDFCEGKPNIEFFISGNNINIILAARLDNLGKGASAAAVQCLDIMIE